MILNQVVVAGHLTQDPEVRQVTVGDEIRHVATLRLAVRKPLSRAARDQGKSDTVFIDASIWGQGARYAMDYLTKGREVVVTGSLDERTWTEGEGSEAKKRSRIQIRASSVSGVGRMEEDTSGSDDPMSEPPVAPTNGSSKPKAQAATRTASEDSVELDESGW